MQAAQLHKLVLQIRALAMSNEWVVLRGNKTLEWKNQLLQYLSNEVVRNHLLCLHPFQFYRSNSSAGVYEFKVNLYSDHIYLKVNVKTLEVLSFHYDEIPYSDEGIASIAENIELMDDLQIIVERGPQGYQANFAIGSNVLTQPIDPIFKDGVAWLDSEQYLDMLKSLARGIQRKSLRQIEVLDKQAIKKLLGPSNDYGILSYSDGQLQVISLCYDLWRKHPGERWIQDIALDAILQQDPKIQQQFAEHLHTSMPAIPSTFGTHLFDNNEQ